MTWTYDPTMLATSPLMQVRLMVEDTRIDDRQLDDEEIEWIITQEGSTYLAAARSAETIAARYAREVDMGAGSLRLAFSQLSERYATLAKSLRAKARMNVAPYAGGTSVSDKQANEANADRTPPAFWSGMEANVGAPGPTDRPLSSSG